MRKYNFTKTFIGTNGISVKGGYSTPDVEEAAVKSEVLKRGRNNFILGDHTKFDKEYAVTFGILKDACIVTDELEVMNLGNTRLLRRLLHDLYSDI